eukprot:8507832-Ditylum_brightwellii.AAC.2
MTAITHVKTTINISWAGAATTTTKTANTQAEIATVTTEAAAIPIKIITAIDMAIIVTRKAKEVTVTMTGKEKINIVLTIKASHIMWRKSMVSLAPNPRVAVGVFL